MVLETADRHISIKDLSLETPEKGERVDIAAAITPRVWAEVANHVREYKEQGKYVDVLSAIYLASLLDPAKSEQIGLNDRTKEQLILELEDEIEQSQLIKDRMSAMYELTMFKHVAPTQANKVSHDSDARTQIEEAALLELANRQDRINIDRLLNLLMGVGPERVVGFLGVGLVSEEGLEKIKSRLIEEVDMFLGGSELPTEREVASHLSDFRILFPDRFDKKDFDPRIWKVLYDGALESLVDCDTEMEEKLSLVYQDLLIALEQAAAVRILSAETLEVRDGVIHLTMPLDSDVPAGNPPQQRKF